MIFAAGFGTRMGDLTRDKPKPLINVAGQALIDHALTWVSGYGVETVVVNLHYKADMLRTYLVGRNILFSEETPDILETGGGLKAALPMMGHGPVFTMNSDAVWSGPNPLHYLAERWDPNRMDALLLCVPPANAIGHSGTGDFLINADGHLSRGPGEIYSGLQIIKSDKVADVKKRVFSLNVVWDAALESGRVFGASYPGKWCDVGHPTGIALAEEMLGTRHA